MIEIWNNFIYLPLFNLLILFSRILFSNLGLGIIAITLLIRLILVPLTVPSLRNMKKMQNLKPLLDDLKKQYGSDKKKLMEQQARLYREHNINPLTGCLPNIFQIVILIALYNAFISGLKVADLSANFLIWNLTQVDKSYILPILAGSSQLIYSKMVSPSVEKHSEKPPQEKKESVEDMAMSMQNQMLYL